MFLDEQYFHTSSYLIYPCLIIIINQAQVKQSNLNNIFFKMILQSISKPESQVIDLEHHDRWNLRLPLLYWQN